MRFAVLVASLAALLALVSGGAEASTPAPTKAPTKAPTTAPSNSPSHAPTPLWCDDDEVVRFAGATLALDCLIFAGLVWASFHYGLWPGMDKASRPKWITSVEKRNKWRGRFPAFGIFLWDASLVRPITTRALLAVAWLIAISLVIVTWSKYTSVCPWLVQNGYARSWLDGNLASQMLISAVAVTFATFIAQVITMLAYAFTQNSVPV